MRLLKIIPFLFIIFFIFIPIRTSAETIFSVPVVTSDMNEVRGLGEKGATIELYRGRNTDTEPISKMESLEGNEYFFQGKFIVGEVYSIVQKVVDAETNHTIKTEKVFTVIDAKKQKISSVTDKSSFILGLVSKNEKVKLTYNNKSVFVKADDSGVYKHELVQKFKGGEKVSLYTLENGTYVYRYQIKVRDVTPPKVPYVSSVHNYQTKITGKSEPTARITMYVSGEKVQSVKANKTGDFSFYTKLLHPKTTVAFTAEDSSKNKSKMNLIKVKSKVKSEKRIINVPLIKQMPELPRGCEVTSLAMLLQQSGKKVDKMTLAKEVKKDKTAYKKIGNKIYFGNPYVGFVGSMYTFNKPGLGVYHGPIASLASKYFPGRAVDLTGNSFEAMMKYVEAGKPVWVITNSWFNQLPSSQFQTWHTSKGKIRITYREHSVVITGYDHKYIYVNDPIHSKNRKLLKSNFKKSWNQMGKQAITIL